MIEHWSKVPEAGQRSFGSRERILKKREAALALGQMMIKEFALASSVTQTTQFNHNVLHSPCNR